MRKFTVFTVILTVIVVVISVEMISEDYLPKIRKKTDVAEQTAPLPDSLDLSKVGQTNILGNEIDYDSFLPEEELVEESVTLNGEAEVEEVEEDPILRPTPPVEAVAESEDFEDENFVDYSTNVYLREDMVKSSGFVNGFVEEELHNGLLYKSVYVDDLADTTLTKYAIKDPAEVFAKAYVFNVGPLSNVNDIYEVLKVRSSEGLNVEINEVSGFGNAAFFMNDARRQNVAFLTVKFDNVIYGFSYPKNYHQQIKNLITLIDLEF